VASLTIIIYDHNSFIIQATGLTGKRSSLFTAAVPGWETGVGLLEGLLPTVEHRNTATDTEVQEQEDDQGGQAGRRQRVELKNVRLSRVFREMAAPRVKKKNSTKHIP
jgi:hypothetical protein